MTRRATPFGFESTTSDVLHGVDLSGKTALVTGANAGIGYETARALASAGATVVVAARKDAAGLGAAGRIIESTGNPLVSHVLLDLANLESVASAASAWRGPLHILVNNAGVMAVPELTRTKQGHELQFATNYLGHFALTLGLHQALANADGARIVSLSSNAHLYSPVVFGDLDVRFRVYEPIRAYAESKTATVLLAVEATRRWAADGIYANAVNPGAIATGLQKHTGGLKTAGGAPQIRRTGSRNLSVCGRVAVRRRHWRTLLRGRQRSSDTDRESRPVRERRRRLRLGAAVCRTALGAGHRDDHPRLACVPGRCAAV
jgi:NAD(P)-dependent dehydrogenase (short-subunit alcohol dehydrogenase family)